MIDLLEAMLEEEEEQGQEEALPPSAQPGGGRLRRRGPWAKSQKFSRGESRAKSPAEGDRAEGDGVFSAAGRGERGEEVLKSAPIGREGSPEPAGRGRLRSEESNLLVPKGPGGAGEALYRQLARTRRAAAYRREPGKGWQSLDRPTGGNTGETGMTAAHLDRLVQRDARRYDGGFSWL